jgi:hypothetical protein
MDTALAAALCPLASSSRLGDLEAKLRAEGAVDVRVVAELLETEGVDFLADLLGIEDTFTEAEVDILKAFVKKIGVNAAIQKRVRAADTHADDVLAVFKASKIRKREGLETSVVAPFARFEGRAQEVQPEG